MNPTYWSAELIQKHWKPVNHVSKQKWSLFFNFCWLSDINVAFSKNQVIYSSYIYIMILEFACVRKKINILLKYGFTGIKRKKIKYTLFNHNLSLYFILLSTESQLEWAHSTRTPCLVEDSGANYMYNLLSNETKKKMFLCHAWYGTIKSSPCSKDIATEHEPR